MQMFLTILLWVLGILLALLLLLLFCPAVAEVRLNYDKLTVRARILGIPFTVWPQKEKKPKKEKKEPKEKPEPKPKKEKQTPSKKFELTFSKVVSIASMAGRIMRRFLAALHIRGVKLVLPVSSGDAASTALFYGRFCAFFYGGLATLQNIIDIQAEDINIIPDFGGDNKYRRSFYCKIEATPFIMLGVALYAFKQLKEERIL